MSSLSPEQTLWFVANSLIKEEALEIPNHWEHSHYAGEVLMQELILKLYPEEVIERAA